MKDNIILYKSFKFAIRVVELYQYLIREKKESRYWIDLLIETEYLDNAKEYIKSFNKECEELNKLLISIIKITEERQKDEFKI